MTRGVEEADAREDLLIPLDKPQHSSFSQHGPVVIVVAGRRPLIRMARVLVLLAPYNIFGLGECRHDRIAVAGGVPAAVVEVKMRVYHEVDVGGGEPEPRQLSLETHVVLDPVNPDFLFAVLVTAAGVDQDIMAAGPDQQAIEAQPDAVLLVGRSLLFP
jgi:hypothetical protein